MEIIVDRIKVHRSLVILRWIVFLIVPVLIFLSKKNPTPSIWMAVGLFGLINIFLSLYVYYRPHNRYITLVWVYAWLYDILLIIFAITQRDGIQSDIYNMFYMVIVQAGLLYAVRGAIFTSLFTSTIYIGAIYITGEQPDDVNRAIIRSIFFVIIGMLIGYLAKLEKDAMIFSLTDYKTKLPN